MLDHMKKLRNSSLVGNTGPFVNEFGLPDSKASEGMKVDNVDLRKVVSSSLIALDHMNKLLETSDTSTTRSTLRLRALGRYESSQLHTSSPLVTVCSCWLHVLVKELDEKVPKFHSHCR